MIRRLCSASSFAALLALGACGSSDGGSESSGGTSDFAGLWDASDSPLGESSEDERYVAISADGRYTEYDYRQDGAANDGNCYLVTEFRLEFVGTRDEQPVGGEEGSLTDQDPVEFEGESSSPTYRLDDGRTVSFLYLEGFGFDANGSFSDGLPQDSLLADFGEGREGAIAVIWPAVTGLSTEDLTPCDASDS